MCSSVIYKYLRVHICIFRLLQISRAASLQHLNVGGTFITDASLFAIADNCPQLKVLILF